MHVTLVHIHVKPEHVADLVAASLENARAAVDEPGNLRFDLLQSREDPTRFVFYEAYRDEAAAQAHKTTPHYLRWRDAVADWMAEPRVGVGYDGLLPPRAEAGTEAGTAPGAGR